MSEIQKQGIEIIYLHVSLNINRNTRCQISADK